MKSYNFKLCVEGEIMASETINFTLSVKAAAAALKLVDAAGNTLSDGDTVALADETVGVADPGQTVLTVSGGTAPYSFSVSAGAIPDGDSLSSVVNADESETVTLEGTPTTAGDNAFSLTVTDSAGASKTVTAKKAIS